MYQFIGVEPGKSKLEELESNLFGFIVPTFNNALEQIIEIEMKSGVGYKTWLESIKPKVRTSYDFIKKTGKLIWIPVTKLSQFLPYFITNFS